MARRSWSWLLAWLRPWATLLGALLAVGPWFYGHSATGIWSAQLRNARTSEGIGGAYVLAGVVLAVAFLVDRGRHSWWSRALLITALIGGTGALGWYDPITALTGVHP